MQKKENYLYNYSEIGKICIGKTEKDSFLREYQDFYRQGQYSFVIPLSCLNKLSFLTLINLFVIMKKAGLLKEFIVGVLVKVKRRVKWRA